MERSVTEQEREIKDAVRRARSQPDKTGPLRRKTFRQLIDLIHSPHPSLRIFAAQNIRFFFSDFPEMEEMAINAVYDLCEDQQAKVRTEGYGAITHVSRAENKWVKRNVDVLVQLLQSDEPSELAVVKKALLEHLDMDPTVTLGVLCDQIIPPDETIDEEEQVIRDRLRGLVLSFLTGEAKKPILERHATSGSNTERAFIEQLLAAVRKLSLNEVEIIVKELLLSLNAFKSETHCSFDLYDIVVNRIASYPRTRFRPGDPALNTFRHHLDLLKSIVLTGHLVPAVKLLHFYLDNLASKISLSRFPVDHQAHIVCDLTEILQASSDGPSSNDDVPSIEALRRHIVDACPILLEPLALEGLLSSRTVNACKVLIQLCQDRRNSGMWTMPPNLIAVLRKIQTVAESQHVQGVQETIMPLVSVSSSHESQATTSVVPTGLPPRPMVQMPRAGSRSLQSSIRSQARPKPPETSRPRRATPQPPAISKREIEKEASSRPLKKRKSEGGESETQASLLDRLGSSSMNGSGSRGIDITHSQAAQQKSPESVIFPNVGYSIKGAAKLAAGTSSPPSRVHASPPQSLLQRLGNGDHRSRKT